MLLVLYFSGCASRGVTEVDANALNYELNYEIGTIEYMKPVVVKDNGNGTFIGAISGVVLGSMVGRGNGNALATLVGGLGGAYVGNEINKANALELGVVLDSGRRVVVITKGKNFSNGERVRIVKRNGRIYSVEAL
ncbi:glycine zipper 2TM domain-containing protein [Sulfurimonas sp.]|uniref:glycine zipper 2TM domain-containing protein n=1 Tax=Sulfurimonas sp. TaxID=2022749 RepID=UPI0026371E2D|nr:glycine zipper 2TM domain-containing protein [Sulfurimonas sp.]